MNEIVAAQYRENRISAGNPLLDALPEQLTIHELYEKLYHVDPLPEDYRKYSPPERIELTERISDTYIPLDYTVSIYASVCQGLRSAYRGKNQVDITRQLAAIGTALEYKQYTILPDSDVQADSISVLGESGMGKTETMRKICKLFPQVIEHTSYKGKVYRQIQLTYLCVECPANHSQRGLCVQILFEVDRVLGTNLKAEAEKRHGNVDMLIARISQVCVRFCIGMIIIDEIQNVLVTSAKDPTTGTQLVKFLVELSNKTGVCLVYLGTSRVIPFFAREPHLARRTRGPRIPALEEKAAFEKIVEIMWAQQAVLQPAPITSQIRHLIYDLTGGVLAKMSKLLIYSARDAIIFGKETVDETWLKETAQRYDIAPDMKAFREAKDPKLLISEGRFSPKIKEAIRSDVHRGRPKHSRDKDDLLVVFQHCQKMGLSVAKRVLYIGLAEEVKRQ